VLRLFRHGSAGDSNAWVGDDRERPLDEHGRVQAESLVGLLASNSIERVLTSPYRRCVESVEPLARARGLPIEYRAELGDDAEPEDALALIRSLAGEAAVLCSHGDLIQALLGEELDKGAVAVVEPTEAGLAVAGRLAPPA
jgi:phosphohistidine phosphatase SixA